MPIKVNTEQLEKSIELAQILQKPQEQAKSNLFSKRIGPLIESPKSKVFLIRLMDASFRSKNRKRIASFVLSILKRNSNYTKVFNQKELILIKLFKLFAHKIAFISIPLMLQQIKKVTRPILFFVGTSTLKNHLKNRNSNNRTLNINLIGEALIGEEEANRRIENYVDLLNQNNVNYISIKISTICSLLKPLAFNETVNLLVEKLSILYTEALRIEKETGQQKFINLDMEEYRDLELTVATFINTLNKPEFKHLKAGIVLQAYLPDSFFAMQELQNWAQERFKNGGSPVKVRLVKGANLEMERTEAALENWPLAPYNSKLETDANYKKMICHLLDPKSANSLHVGVASHNIFDLAFALQIVQEKNIESYIDFEMLEGMANETVAELLKQKVHIVLYTPIVKEKNYNSAMAYLVRRLDEGTQPGNFLKEGFQLKTGSKKWNTLQQHFIDSVTKIPKVQELPNRNQNRATDPILPQIEFKNTPNTDWTLKQNRTWISEMKTRWQAPNQIIQSKIPIVADLPEKKRELLKLSGWNGVAPWAYELADYYDYKMVIDGQSSWQEITAVKRAEILRAAAVEIEKNRADLIGVAITELGKTVPEIDVEISEAIDFANYYVQNSLDQNEIPYEASGINLVLSPWNFPLAIPIGGVLASLAAGKRVILKPSQNAAACAYLISKCLWDAGIPKSAFAFLPAKENTLDPFLTDHTVFDAIILTGSTDTARFLLDRTPKLKLFAETGGKNATIITAMSDREQAIKNVVQSAFGNTGQKCSATSLLILEEEVFQDENFKELLRDCTESKVHGNPWDFATDIGPLAVEISDKLLKSIKKTPDEAWLVKPKIIGKYSLTPGIKWGVTTEDYEYQNELFGPILAVIKAKDLKDAIHIANGVDYGLTSGLESLAPQEVSYWTENIKAGNLYVNRPTTGAVVERQPFGGIKASSFGFGMKAGGPNYVLQFLRRKEKSISPSEISEDYKKAYNTYFSKSIDYSKLRGQHNKNRFLKPKKIIICLDNHVSFECVTRVKLIAEILEVACVLYTNESFSKITYPFEVKKLDNWRELLPELNHETVVRVLNYERISDDFLRMCHNAFIPIYSEKPSNYGRYEFLNYLKEQNQSINYHRYGNCMGVKSE
ncbi:proline dehydrogenase family protein [Flavicella sediminum]|uniref:proline dehydrogenase family protein n=1 Tax=Flavicella sediminum TaxID=2585141 RepID=UPI00111F3936|nr:bifunctional proline dehydrogenase/L-glutamate gamma-semialdehyde dehydrogenase [Flavicella sediminum]